MCLSLCLLDPLFCPLATCDRPCSVGTVQFLRKVRGKEQRCQENAVSDVSLNNVNLPYIYYHQVAIRSDRSDRKVAGDCNLAVTSI